MLNLLPVPFRGTTLYVVDVENVSYTPMKPKPNSHLSKNALLQFKKRLLPMHFESNVGHIGDN